MDGGGQGRGPGDPISRNSPQRPHGADPQLWSYFSAGGKDRSDAISAHELQNALAKGPLGWDSFDLDTVKLFISIFDVYRRGTIRFNEFTRLWKHIKDWQRGFLKFDRDRSGTIDGKELQAALNHLGYKPSPDLLDLMQRKYDVKWSTPPAGGEQAAPPEITFDRFVRACVVAMQLA